MIDEDPILPAIISPELTPMPISSCAIPRAAHARLVAQLKKAGAQAVIFDVIFADASQRGAGEDAQFAAAVRDAGNIFLPVDHDASEATAPALLKKIEDHLSYPIEATSTAETVRIQPPIPALFEAMKGGGQVAAKPDTDATFRSAVILMESGKVYPHIVLDAVARSVWKLDPKKTPPVIKDDYLVWGERRIGPLTRRALQRSLRDAG